MPSNVPILEGILQHIELLEVGLRLGQMENGKTTWMELISGDVSFNKEEDIERPSETRKQKFAVKKDVPKPDQVCTVPCFLKDLQALEVLFSEDKPMLQLVRGMKICLCIYRFGDASGGGFSSSWMDKDGIGYRFGTWGEDMRDKSSNLRKLLNLVDTLEKPANDDTLKGFEIFLFADNSTSEAAFFNGSSSGKKLFEIGNELSSQSAFVSCLEREDEGSRN